MTEAFERPVVEIYTDGACDPNPGPGGWAAILRFGKHEKVLTGCEVQSTNNRMELTAAVEALRTLTHGSRVSLYTDSEYLKRGITEWLAGWRRRNWRRKEGKLANVELWRALDAEAQKHEIEWHWVKGHSGHPENRRVDRLARAAIHRG
jgi:ribonuclease HI